MISDLDLLQAVKDETSEEFVVYGELGREKSAGVALLALEKATNELVVLIVSATTGADGAVELGVDVRTELDARVPDVGTFCISCGTRLRPWGRFCPNCGLDVLGQVEAPDADPTEMRAAIEESITGDYELLGEMRRKEGGGRVYFAREKSSGRIAALRLTKGMTEGEFELGETRIIKKSKMADAGMSLSVTQLLRPIEGADVPERVTAERGHSAPGNASHGKADRSPARPTPESDTHPNAASGPKRDWVAEGAEWARKNWGPLAGVGVAAILGLLGWAAISA